MKNLTLKDLENKKPFYIKLGYPIPKWIQFAEAMIKDNWDVSYYDSITTVSKYIYIRKNNKSLKIRFSNHKPNRIQEQINDSDFYVGISNFGVIKTEDLIKKIKNELD